MFAREEKEFGVPAAVITAFWGLESDFGAGQGKDQALKSLTTLAYDCRRSDMFRGHLFDALRMIERGDLRPEEMIGSWAGELGQTQMMPSEDYRDAVIYDGSGRRDLIHSAPNVIGSTGKYLVFLGWKRGEPWLQEVRAPANFRWDQADLSIQHPRSQWAASGVTYADGRPLPSDNLPASLVLPMGRFGPTFLAYDNFQVYLKWNQSLMYALTAAYYATRLDGAPAMHRGGDIPKLSFEETRELQQILEKRGYDIGRTDGILGLKSRSAVREMQIKFSLPADLLADRGPAQPAADDEVSLARRLQSILRRAQSLYCALGATRRPNLSAWPSGAIKRLRPTRSFPASMQSPACSPGSGCIRDAASAPPSAAPAGAAP